LHRGFHARRDCSGVAAGGIQTGVTHQVLNRVGVIQLCHWLNEKRDMATSSRLIPITDELTHLVAELSVKRLAISGAEIGL
jgi:hypothetical protein